MNQNLKILVVALVAAVVFWSVILALDSAGVHWQKWFQFMVWTAFVFGILAFKFAEDLDEKIRCLLVFLALLTIHLTVGVLYVRTVTRFPNYFFLLFSPFEAGIGAFILTVLGGARLLRRTHGIKPPPKRPWPPGPA